MWLFWLLPLGFISIFVFSFTFAGISAIKDKEKKVRVRKLAKRLIFIIETLFIVPLIIFQFAGFRIDTAGGQHIIIPTAVDTDLWGNYKVYYKTTVFEGNQAEGYYMIEKEREDLANEAKEYMKKREQIIVYYERYIGFKGISSPKSAPIIKMEKLESSADSYYNY